MREFEVYPGKKITGKILQKSIYWYGRWNLSWLSELLANEDINTDSDLVYPLVIIISKSNLTIATEMKIP